jgi:hypothetical protein
MGDANRSEKRVEFLILSPPNQIGRQGFGAQVVIQQVYEIQENI